MSRCDRAHRGVLIRIAPAIIVAASACGGDPPITTESYCTALAEEHQLLTAPILTLGDIDATVQRYQAMARRSPLDIRPQWERIAGLLLSAATADISDPAARLTVIEQAYETERDANEIAFHAASVCQISLDTSGTIPLTIPLTTPPVTPSAAPQSPPAAVAPAVTSGTPPGAPAPPPVDSVLGTGDPAAASSIP